jgi:Na+-driven multidrug efflux pump
MTGKRERRKEAEKMKKLLSVLLALALLLPCIALGMAQFIMQSSESVISVCFNASLLKYGGDLAVGAMTILTSVMQFAMLPMLGLAQGAQPICSFNYGAGNVERVKKTFRLLLASSMAYSILLWGAIMAFPGMFAAIFTSEGMLLDFTEKVLRIYCGALGIFGIQIACQMTFVSLGKALSSVTVAVMRKFVLLLPLIFILPQFVKDQTLGVYLAEPIADVLAVTFTAILFAFQFKAAIRSMEKDVSECAE